MSGYIIMKTIFGSHLYGTVTSESDTDYKGVFMPSSRDIYLGRFPKSYKTNTKIKKGDGIKNTKDDIDTEIYSLHEFIKLACEGQTVALDMLHAPESGLIIDSLLWHSLLSFKHLFYTKNTKAFVGYARRQAAKHGVKGSRLNAAQNVINFLYDLIKIANPYDSLANFWHLLPKGEHIHFLDKPSDKNNLRVYQVCGKNFQETAKLDYVFNILSDFHAKYGERARKAARNEGIDWKAISHALRASYEIQELFQMKTITFPLKEAKFLTEVKKGKHHYKSVSDTLEELMENIEYLSTISDLPEKVDRQFWDDWLEIRVREYLL